MRVGTKVHFTEATTGSSVKDESEVPLPAGATGKIVKVINDMASVVNVAGRQYVVWNDDFTVTPCKRCEQPSKAGIHQSSLHPQWHLFR